MSLRALKYETGDKIVGYEGTEIVCHDMRDYHYISPLAQWFK
jgi:hypothetical protein